MSEHSPRKFRLVAADLDQTLKAREEPISDRVQEAVATTVAAGVIFIIATGRRFSSVLPFARQLGLRTPVICYGGAVIKDVLTGRTLYCQTIPRDLVRRVVAIARAKNLAVLAFTEDEVYAESVAADSPSAAFLASSSAQVVPDLLAGLPDDPCHMALASDETQTRSLVLDLRAELDGHLNVTCGHPLLAEIDHPMVSKGEALARVAAWLGVERSEVLAIGDDWNDIAMLQYAGLGVAMGNAQQEVLAVADAIAPSVAEDGVAWVLEKYVLGAVWPTEAARS